MGVFKTIALAAAVAGTIITAPTSMAQFSGNSAYYCEAAVSESDLAYMENTVTSDSEAATDSEAPADSEVFEEELPQYESTDGLFWTIFILNACIIGALLLLIGISKLRSLLRKRRH